MSMKEIYVPRATVPEEEPKKAPGVLRQIGKTMQNKKALLAVGSLLSFTDPNLAAGKPSPKAISTDQMKVQEPEKEAESSFDHPAFFRQVPHGRFSEAEQAHRTRRLAHGEVVFRDIGLTFYRVAPHDTIDKIREKLLQYPEFQHLRQQKEKLKSFNIPARHLKVGMWLPIPLPNEDREISDEQFALFAGRAVEDVLRHKEYGVSLKKYLAQAGGKSALVATMVAVAKQESGGLPIGQFELHRWENHHQVFSFSLFHILMKDAGITARQKLNMTEGQCYHPQNAAKLFLAFIIEKGKGVKKAKDVFFPIQKRPKQFAKFYNGKAWQRTNPEYDNNIVRYYWEAWKMLERK